MKASGVLGCLRVRAVDPACTGTTGAAADYVGGLACPGNGGYGRPITPGGLSCLREWWVRAIVEGWESLPPARSVA